MKLIYKLTLVLLMLPLAIVANDKKKHEKSRTVQKEFTVNEDATVYIKNKYGNVKVETWNENRVTIDVKITVRGNNKNKVEDRFNSIDIEFNNTKNLVEARTIIGSKKSSWSWWGNNNSKLNYEINYLVRMPKSNQADLHNKYGNIYLDELNGKANIDCDYGKISIDKLNNDKNTITLDYCSNSNINFMSSGNISADYSKLTIEESNELTANLDYTNFNVGTVKTIDFNTDYGSVTIDEATDIDGNSDYAGMRIGTVKKNLKINTDYGGLRVKNLAKGFENVTIDGSYAGIRIGTPSDNNFDFVINLGYAGFSYSKGNVEMFKSIKKTSKKYYEGTWGKQNSGSKISIKSGYGSVSIKENN